MSNYLCKPENLIEICRQIFCAKGLALNQAEDVARQLVEADIAGIHSHGLVRIEWYLNQAMEGAINLQAKPVIIKESPISAIVDDFLLDRVGEAGLEIPVGSFITGR